MTNKPICNPSLSVHVPPGTPAIVCQEHGSNPDKECIVCFLLWKKEALDERTRNQ